MKANKLKDSQTGVIVKDVERNAPAFQKLFVSDIITEVTFPEKVRGPVRNAADLMKALGGLKDGEFVGLKVMFPDSRNPGELATRVVNLRVGN